MSDVRARGRRRAPALHQVEARRPTRDRKPQLPLTVTRPELLVEGSDQLYRRLVHGLLSFAAMHEAIRDGIASSIELGGVQHTILQSIIHLEHAHRVTVSAVANHLNLSVSFITMETTKLQKLGLIEKRQATSDRRKVLLTLTEKGLALFERVAPLQRTVGDVQFGCLTARQFRELAPMVERLVESSREALLLLHYLKAANGSAPPQVEFARKRAERRAPS